MRNLRQIFDRKNLTDNVVEWVQVVFFSVRGSYLVDEGVLISSYNGKILEDNRCFINKLPKFDKFAETRVTPDEKLLCKTNFCDYSG